MMQENMAQNRIIVEKVGDVHQAVVASATNENKSRAVIQWVPKKSLLHLKHARFQTMVNVIAVMKAMGCVHEQEICALICSGCANEDDFHTAPKKPSAETMGRPTKLTQASIMEKIMPSLQECKDLQIKTQRQALEYLGKAMKEKWVSSKAGAAQKPAEKWMQARAALELVFML